jgi:hypothetical protein
MTTAVYSAIQSLHSAPTMICALSDTTPDQAIDVLKRVGIIALPSEYDEAAIVLVGFSYEISTLIQGIARQESLDRKSRAKFIKQRRKILAS